MNNTTQIDMSAIHSKTLSIWEDRPLRVMQVHALYPQYLPYYYEKYPRVAQASFDIQTKALLKDGLFALHMLTDELSTMGCETMMVFANAEPLQKAWAKERGFTPDILRNHPELWEYIILAAQIEDFRPDVLYFSDNHNYDGKFLRILSTTPPVICAYRCAPVDLESDWTGFDIIFSMLDHICAMSPLLGAGEGIPFCCGYPISLARKVDTLEQDTDVVFAGTYETRFNPSVHAGRRAILNAVGQAAGANNYSLGLALSDGRDKIPAFLRPYIRPQAYGIAMQQETRRGKIALDIQGWVNASWRGKPLLRLTGGETATMRLFESIGGGSLTFTEERARITRYFTPGQDLETYTSPEDLIDKIHYYLSHPEERERLASSGQKRCRTVFSKRRQATEFLRITRHKLEEKKLSITRPAHTVKLPSPAARTRLLELLRRCDPKEDSARELEKELFLSACLLARNGSQEEARTLDRAVLETAFARWDLGAIMHARIC